MAPTRSLEDYKVIPVLDDEVRPTPKGASLSEPRITEQRGDFYLAARGLHQPGY